LCAYGYRSTRAIACTAAIPCRLPAAVGVDHVLGLLGWFWFAC